MKTQELIYDLDQLPKVVELLSNIMKTCSILTFTGSLGAGKTTLVQALLRAHGITGAITSPTFTYVNVYENERGETFYHFDLYRIGSIDEFINQGFDEYLHQPKSWSFIEWPEVIAPLLGTNVCHISLDYYDHKRKMSISIS